MRAVQGDVGMKGEARVYISVPVISRAFGKADVDDGTFSKTL